MLVNPQQTTRQFLLRALLPTIIDVVMNVERLSGRLDPPPRCAARPTAAATVVAWLVVGAAGPDSAVIMLAEPRRWRACWKSCSTVIARRRRGRPAPDHRDLAAGRQLQRDLASGRLPAPSASPVGYAGVGFPMIGMTPSRSW